MKRSTIICIAVTLCLAATPAMAALYTVELGTIGTGGTQWMTAGVSISGWGEAEPATTGGGYGGFGSNLDYHVEPATTATWDHQARMVWGASGSLDGDGAPANANAFITFPTAITSATIRHLDGSAGDSFTVWVDGVQWSFAGDKNGDKEYDAGGGLTGDYAKTTGEQWFETAFHGTAGTVLKIDITNQNWNSTYGQLAIDRVQAVPVPAAVLLGMLGLSAAGLKLRKYV